MSKRSYMCCLCNHIFEEVITPKYCPNCGKSEISPQRAKARITALEYIEQLKRDQEVLLAMWNGYARQYVVVEKKLQILRQYKKRGIVTDDEIPKLKKPKLVDMLKEYRTELKGEKENGIC